MCKIQMEFNTDAEREAYLNGYELAKKMFKRNHGEWKYAPKLRLVDETDDGPIYETAMRCFCSACGADFGFRKVDDAFCRFCGADMRTKEGGAE